MNNKSNLIIQGEPREVTNARQLILKSFNKLRFDEGPHKYYLGDVEYKSVSETIKQFEQQENWDIIAENYANKHGETASYWKDQWHYNNLKATMTGTRVHSFLEGAGWQMNGHPELIPDDVECQYIRDKDWMIPFHNKEIAGLSALRDLHKHFWLVLNETRVYTGLNKDPNMNPKQPWAGTFDMLYYYDGNGDGDKAGFIICDWKTNKSLTNDFARKKKTMMLPPFNNMIDEALSHYSLQFSCYQIPLEDIGLKVIGRRLFWLKDDCTYEKINTPNLTGILRKKL